MLLRRIIVYLVIFGVTAPGFSNENTVFPKKRNYSDQREYVRDSLLFFRNIELSAASDGSNESISDASYIGKKRSLFSSENSSLLKDLFENDKRLSHWMKTSSVPLFAAILADNLDLIQFFERNQESVLVKRYHQMYAVQFAVIIPSEKAIQYFFDHPSIDLSVVNRFGDNLFHLIFLGSGTISSKARVLNIFLQDNNFSKVAYLLNTPNIDGETVTDFALREERPWTAPIKRMINTFLERGAVALGQQELLAKFEEKEREEAFRIKRNSGQRLAPPAVEIAEDTSTKGDIDALRAEDRKASEETVRILTRERKERAARRKQTGPCPGGFSR